jgi:outer membrane protein assembly factor BamB
MVALKASDGSVAWSFPSGRAIMGEALVTEDSVFFVCDNGYLFKLNRADGKELWRYDLGDARVTRILPNPIIQPQDGYDHLAPKPVLAEDTLYVGAGDGGFHAVRADSGERVWRIQSKGAIRSTAAVRGPNVFFSTMEGLVVALERSGGRQLWQVQSQLPVTSSPVFVGDKLVIGGRDSILQALDPATGAQLWKFSFWGSWVESSATPSPENDGVAYIGSSDLRRVTSFDANAGRILWRTDVFGCPWGRPLVTDKFVYVATIGSKPYPMRHEAAIVALERATGRLLWRWALPQPAGVYFWGFPGSITRAGELMVIGGMDGTLYAFPTQ